MRKIKLPKETEITKKLIEELIEKHSVERSRILKMKRYYNNDNDIMYREYEDPNKPQNKLSHNYAKLITDNYVGYLVGKPVSYKSDNENLLEKLNVSFLYNDEIDNNTTLAQEQSICGYAYELLYRDELSNVRFACVDTEDTIVVYDNTLEAKELFAIRYIQVDDDKYKVYAYDKEKEYIYTMENKKIGELQEENIHYFDDVPVCTYENNRQRRGDFEGVITLIDAYDKANSDTANDFEYFTNALLVVSGVVMEDESNPLNFKDNRVLNFADTTSKAEYLIKNINDTALENYKNRLVNDIHKFSGSVNMSDDNFSNNASGISLKFKFNSMELNTSIKESKFKKGLMKRIELLTGILKIKSKIKTDTEYTYTEIKPVFTRNIPANETELVEIFNNLYGKLSDETVFSMLPFVENAKEEIEKVRKQEEESFEDYDFGEDEDEVEDGVVNE